MAKRKPAAKKSVKIEATTTKVVETYESVEGRGLKPSTRGARAAPMVSAFRIVVRFLGGMTATQRDAFKKAADRWTSVIVGDLPAVQIGQDVIDDLLIEARGVPIDGVGKILGQAGPTNLRPATSGASALLPAKGLMSFDTADLANMERNGTLIDVITHEMGHVVGIGTVWQQKGLLTGAGSSNPLFTGKNARREYGILKGGGPESVPVENKHGPGTRDSHWREELFLNELMSGFIATANNPLSKLTVASLQDMGYVVDMSAAEPYSLPNLRSIAERGLRAAADEPHGHALPIFAPTILPDEALEVP